MPEEVIKAAGADTSTMPSGVIIKLIRSSSGLGKDMSVWGYFDTETYKDSVTSFISLYLISYYIPSWMGRPDRFVITNSGDVLCWVLCLFRYIESNHPSKSLSM